MEASNLAEGVAFDCGGHTTSIPQLVSYLRQTEMACGGGGSLTTAESHNNNVQSTINMPNATNSNFTLNNQNNTTTVAIHLGTPRQTRKGDAPMMKIQAYGFSSSMRNTKFERQTLSCRNMVCIHRQCSPITSSLYERPRSKPLCTRPTCHPKRPSRRQKDWDSLSRRLEGLATKRGKKSRWERPIQGSFPVLTQKQQASSRQPPRRSARRPICQRGAENLLVTS